MGQSAASDGGYLSNLRNIGDVAASDGLKPHEWLCFRSVAWLVGSGFRVAAAEVPVGRETRRPPAEKGEVADACGVGIIAGKARCRVVEVKVTRADFLSDHKKEHRKADFGDGVTERYYVTPVGLVRKDEVPEPWGLAEWSGISNTISIVKRAKTRRLAGRAPGKRTAPNLSAPWDYGLEDVLPGGRNAWTRAWWRVMARIVNAYEFDHLGLTESSSGRYSFGTMSEVEAVSDEISGEATATSRYEEEADLPRMAAIASETWDDFVLHPAVSGTGEDYFERNRARHAAGQTVTVVGDYASRVAGIMELSIPTGGREMEIVHLAVSARYRGLGVGDALVAAATSAADRLGVVLAASTWSTAVPAISLYAKHGLSEESRARGERAGGRIDGIRMSRRPAVGGMMAEAGTGNESVREAEE